MRHMIVAACVFGLPLMSGCGLIVVPTSRQFPGPVKSIRIVDAETKAPISGAGVQVQIRRLENWFVQMPMLAEDSGESNGEWEPLARTQGDFAMKPRRATGRKRIWWPLPSVLGPAILDEPYAYLKVTAPRHHGVVYIYSPKSPPTPGAKARKGGKHILADAELDDQGVLVICLARKGAPDTTVPRP